MRTTLFGFSIRTALSCPSKLTFIHIIMKSMGLHWRMRGINIGGAGKSVKHFREGLIIICQQ